MLIVWGSFNTSLYLWLIGWFFNSFKISSIPEDFCLQMKPSCQTSSEAIEISTKTVLTSSNGYESKDDWISWIIECSWYMQESPDEKPDLHLLNNPLWWKWWKIELYNTLSITLANVGKWLIGLWFLIIFLASFYALDGITLAFFLISGKTQNSIFENLHKGFCRRITTCLDHTDRNFIISMILCWI